MWRKAHAQCFQTTASIKGALKDELKCLQSAGIIEKVSHSDWAAPIVTVLKGDSKLRMCWDYKVTVNPHLDIDQYFLPQPDDLFASLAGGQKFSKINPIQAYLQMVLDEDSRQFVAVNTHLGLYRYTRLPFGTVLYYDILVTGDDDDEEHLRNLADVLPVWLEGDASAYGIGAVNYRCCTEGNKIK